MSKLSELFFEYDVDAVSFVRRIRVELKDFAMVGDLQYKRGNLLLLGNSAVYNEDGLIRESGIDRLVNIDQIVFIELDPSEENEE